MIQTSIHLPNIFRLGVRSTKRRKASIESDPIIPTLEEIRRVRKGSKISRVFTHIFSHKHFKRLLGGNIAAAIVLAGFFPIHTNFDVFEVNTVKVAHLITKTEKGVQLPVAELVVNQGYRIFHPGIDLEGITGDPVNPIMSGRVLAIQFSKYAYGNAIILDHGSGLTSLYAHLSKIEVTDGQNVTKNTVIGKVGSTGRSTGDHLHLEIRQDGRAFNPLTVLPTEK